MRLSARDPILAMLLAALFWGSTAAADGPARDKPLFRDFMGVNGHTILFKPARYTPAAQSVRDYHP
ncbi:MAG: hypothetical protein JWN86_4299, partial [Planctomycetota bacterium]|nr:hypothetical protein [Planctomycetota bacterium]